MQHATHQSPVTGGQAVAARQIVKAANATWCGGSVIVDALTALDSGEISPSAQPFGTDGWGFESVAHTSTQIGAIIDDMDAHDHIVAGSSALAGGQWAAARDCFESALSLEESSDALDGLALAVWWLNAADRARAR